MKDFFTRLLQVVWVLGFLSILGSIFANIAFYDELIAVLFAACVWLAFFSVIQYLVFAKLDPRWLFSGRPNLNATTDLSQKKFLTIVFVSLLLTVMIGIGVNLFNDYQYNKKIKAGNDIVFFNKILNDVVYSHDLIDCYSEQEYKPSRSELLQAVKELESEGVKGLNILVKIADRDDRLGEVIRCAIRDDLTDKIVESTGIKY